jgi:hypothetical protein
MTYQDPNDPLHRDRLQNLPPDDSMASNATWGWVAAAIFAVVVLFLAFTTGRDETQTAANRDMSTPATRSMPSTSGAATNSPAMPSTTPSSPSPSAPAPSAPSR